MSTQKIFTSESVTEGHPDKLCDQISDAVLDAVLQQDKHAHVACETIATTGMTLVMGELSTECYVDIPAVARSVIKDVGYTESAGGFDWQTCAVLTAIDEQSPDIALGVNNALEARRDAADRYDKIGAGDQGMVFGFACTDTPELMPAPIMYAHALTKRLADVRKSGALSFVLPDGKAQVSVHYGEDGAPQRIGAVVLSTQHKEGTSLETIRDGVMEEIIKKVLPTELLNKGHTAYFINPTGKFVKGGPAADSGLTGRKIIVDTYGGYARHGGGSFSGKDPTKVDRSAAYMARYAAKNLVASGLCSKCEIQIAYAIGVAHPVSVYVDSFGTGLLDDACLAKLVTEKFDFRPAAIIEKLDLLRPIYRPTASYGHFGRSGKDFTWEALDMAQILAQYK